MNLDEIIAELRTADLPPAEALRAAVGHADTLAPQIYAQVDRFCRGICLRQDDENLLLYGLHVLAAARHEGLWGKLMELVRATDDDGLDYLFSFHASSSLAALMLSVWDGDADALLRLIEHADLVDNGKWALFYLLARLTFDGRIPSATTAAFLERFEAEGLADDDSGIWWGWQGAVVDLGLTDLEPAMRRAWEKPAFAGFTAEENEELIEDLREAAATPHDPSRFDNAGIQTIDHPADALAWMEKQRQALAQYSDETDGMSANGSKPPATAADSALDIRLSDQEVEWLSRFLVSRQVPPSTMPLEMLDGFLTALIIGPAKSGPEGHFPLIWGEEPGAMPAWEDELQAVAVIKLIARHANAIQLRRAAGEPQQPLFADDPFDAGKPGSAWAEGFAVGVDLLEIEWQPLFEDRNGAEDGLAVVALCDGETEYFGRPATAKERAQIIERLPAILKRLAAFWDDPAKGYPRQQPIKVAKVGRNDPCPCGSDLKYKKCCGK